MAAGYDEAVEELYQAAHEAFVTERKRLSVALKAAGDKAAAARLLELRRPPLSAWAVNQLWWQAGDLFTRLFAAAHALRAGDQRAAAERRDALAALKARAASILVASGHGANEGTLRRVATTLAALAAAGGFEPDPPGALTADRDPPGFDIAAFGPGTTLMSAAGGPSPPPPGTPASAPKARPALVLVPPPAADAAPETGLTSPNRTEVSREPAACKHTERERVEHERAERERAERERAEREQAEREQAEREQAGREQAERERVEREQAERLRLEQDLKRLEAERAARAAERERIEASLPGLRGDLERRNREVERLRAEVRRVEGLAEQARVALDAAEARLLTLRDQSA